MSISQCDPILDHKSSFPSLGQSLEDTMSSVHSTFPDLQMTSHRTFVFSRGKDLTLTELSHDEGGIGGGSTFDSGLGRACTHQQRALHMAALYALNEL